MCVQRCRKNKVLSVKNGVVRFFDCAARAFRGERERYVERRCFTMNFVDLRSEIARRDIDLARDRACEAAYTYIYISV